MEQVVEELLFMESQDQAVNMEVVTLELIQEMMVQMGASSQVVEAGAALLAEEMEGQVDQV